MRHVRQPVRFADAVAALAGQGVTRFLEVGPDAVLSAMVDTCLDHTTGPATTEDTTTVAVAGRAVAVADSAGRGVAVAVLRRDRGESTAVMQAVACLHTHGISPDWDRFFTATGVAVPGRVSLPTYAFEHQRYWPRPARPAGDLRAVGQASAGHPLLAAVVVLAGDGGVVLTGRISWLAPVADRLPGRRCGAGPRGGVGGDGAAGGAGGRLRPAGRVDPAEPAGPDRTRHGTSPGERRRGNLGRDPPVTSTPARTVPRTVRGRCTRKGP